MRTTLTLLIAGAVSSAISITAVDAQSESNGGSALTRERYLPEYTESGDLILPKNFHEWVYVGSPLTPNALNGGEAGFPEFHNVYIEPGSYEIYKKTGEFPEGTRSEEHTSELQSLMRISYAVFCLKKKNRKINKKNSHKTYNK